MGRWAHRIQPWIIGKGLKIGRSTDAQKVFARSLVLLTWGGGVTAKTLTPEGAGKGRDFCRNLSDRLLM